MRLEPLPRRLLAAAIGIAWACAAAAAQAQAQQAGERCEAAVETTLRQMRGRDVASVDFNPARRVVTAVSDDESSVKGEGRHRAPSGAATAFSYTCSFNPQSGATSGVLLREARAAAQAPGKAWQPDMARVSPDDCQSAIVGLLKERHPRVTGIVFDADARQLEPAPNDGTTLAGRGALQRAPGMNSVVFRYRCEFEPKRGRIVDVQAIE